jgi:hypothetical protein
MKVLGVVRGVAKLCDPLGNLEISKRKCLDFMKCNDVLSCAEIIGSLSAERCTNDHLSMKCFALYIVLWPPWLHATQPLPSPRDVSCQGRVAASQYSRFRRTCGHMYIPLLYSVTEPTDTMEKQQMQEVKRPRKM